MGREKDNDLEYKMETESRMTKLETLVTEIKDNHLVHIEAKIDRASWFAVTTMVVIIVQLLFKLFGGDA